MQQHTRAGKAHHLADLCTHRGLVAMHRTLGASGLLGQEGAVCDARLGVSQELSALRAEAALRVVLRMAIECDHLSDGALLLRNPSLGGWSGTISHEGVLYPAQPESSLICSISPSKFLGQFLPRFDIEGVFLPFVIH